MRRKTVKLMAIIAGVFTALVLGIVFVNISVSDAASNKWGYITVTIYPEEVRADARWYITLGDLKQSGETVKVNTSDEVY